VTREELMEEAQRLLRHSYYQKQYPKILQILAPLFDRLAVDTPDITISAGTDPLYHALDPRQFTPGTYYATVEITENDLHISWRAT
jgi:hypothetical protein